jgi:hypothetical protein
VRSEVLKAVKMSMLIFWVVTPCALVSRYQCFGGTCCLHLQSIQWVQGGKAVGAWSYTSTDPFVFMAYCLISTRDNFSWEADSRSEIPRLLWNQKVHCCFHNSPPPVPNMGLTKYMSCRRRRYNFDLLPFFFWSSVHKNIIFKSDCTYIKRRSRLIIHRGMGY